ncbi:MAG: DUF116 domain-containing protein [Candidatus Eisenbacteria sp.]|nr:DUF116 domain-containing protein [Candidatus Eisenbacteria bacterium]
MSNKLNQSSAPDPVGGAGAGAPVVPSEQDPRRRPRRLGDAWEGWDPSQEMDDPRRVAGGASLLLALLGLLAVIAAAGWALLLWLAAPRLASLGLDGGRVTWIWTLGAFLLLLPTLLLWGAWLPVRYPSGIVRGLQRHVFGLWTLAAALARLLGISFDRLGHSFVLVTNRLASLARPAMPGEGLLVLAPRCLKADCMRALRELAAGRCAELVVAGGGEEARAAIQRLAPAGVLAIACERDLVAGLRDVAARLPVLSLPNQRPEGPCRNSTIDLDRARVLLAQLEDLTRR